MNIQINTDHNIQGNEALIAKFSSIIKSSLSRISDNITQVIIYLSDEDGSKSGQNDKRCLIEAHLEGRKPIVVSDNAADLNSALDGAIDKLIGMVDTILGKQHNYKNHKTELPADEEIPEEE